jgi:hypothetical protein
MKNLMLGICLLFSTVLLRGQQNLRTEVIERDSNVLIVSVQTDSAVVSSQRLFQEIEKIKGEIEKRENELKTFRAQMEEYNRLLGSIIATEKRIAARRKESKK